MTPNTFILRGIFKELFVERLQHCLQQQQRARRRRSATQMQNVCPRRQSSLLIVEHSPCSWGFQAECGAQPGSRCRWSASGTGRACPVLPRSSWRWCRCCYSAVSLILCLQDHNQKLLTYLRRIMSTQRETHTDKRL